ncbi:5'-3' exonuclease [Paenibacillus periandrae]|uniref:5'-3' exonuclease n=1 Tax=Paenibacillus periandrae TaxID=1761741 RepID=UPI001F09933E|nr:5'-3' exonuclease [Paenibacillus periandrae]
MNLKVQLPIKATGPSLRTCFESILRQWKDLHGVVRKGRITETGWLEIMIGLELHPGEAGYREVETPRIQEREGIFTLSIVGCDVDQVRETFRLIYKKIMEFESLYRLMGEVVLYKGDGICFKMIKSEWQPSQSSEHLRSVSIEIQSLANSSQDIKKTEAEEPNRSKEEVIKLPASPSLLLIDGMNILSRCYYGSSRGKEEHELMRSTQGVFTNAIKPLTEKLLKVIRKFAPTNILVLWDPPGGRSTLRRRQLADFYKHSRDSKKTPESLKEQIETAKSLFEAMNIKQIHVDSYEADDLAGSISKRWSLEINDLCYLWSNDKDYFQLLDHNVVQLIDDEPFDLEMFTQKYEGITPQQYIDYKGFCGDPSDDIPGIAGIGHTFAMSLLHSFGSMEAAIAAAENRSLDQKNQRFENKLKEGKELGLLSRDLARIEVDIPEMNEILWEDILIKINRNGYLAKMEELEIKQKGFAT